MQGKAKHDTTRHDEDTTNRKLTRQDKTKDGRRRNPKTGKEHLGKEIWQRGRLHDLIKEEKIYFQLFDRTRQDTVRTKSRQERQGKTTQGKTT